MYLAEPKPRISRKIFGRKISPTAKSPDCPNAFASFTSKTILITIFTIGMIFRRKSQPFPHAILYWMYVLYRGIMLFHPGSPAFVKIIQFAMISRIQIIRQIYQYAAMAENSAISPIVFVLLSSKYDIG